MDFPIPETETTPRVTWDAATATLRLAGESYPENVLELFAPLAEWLDTQLGPTSTLHLQLELFYLNTSSMKALVDIIRLLEVKHAQGTTVEVEWRYLRDVDLMRQTGEDLLAGSHLPRRFTPVAAI